MVLAPAPCRRDEIHRYIEMLNGVYARNLHRDEVTLIAGKATFTGPKTVVLAPTLVHLGIIEEYSDDGF